MYVDRGVGAAITMFMQGTQKERPLTHDLLANILRALGAKIDRVTVNDLKGGTYFARLVLSAENEAQQKEDHRDRCAAAIVSTWPLSKPRRSRTALDAVYGRRSSGRLQSPFRPRVPLDQGNARSLQDIATETSPKSAR